MGIISLAISNAEAFTGFAFSKDILNQYPEDSHRERGYSSLRMRNKVLKFLKGLRVIIGPSPVNELLGG